MSYVPPNGLAKLHHCGERILTADECRETEGLVQKPEFEIHLDQLDFTPSAEIIDALQLLLKRKP